MADTKISALTDGVTANAADKIPIERSLANRYITPAYVRTYLGFGVDNTMNDATTTEHGLLLKLGGGTSNFLRADGTWNAPSGLAESFITKAKWLDF